MYQDLPQPRQELCLGRASKLLEVPMGFQQRLLHKIRRTEPSTEPTIQLGLGQQMQVVPIQLQNASQAIRSGVLSIMAQEVLDAFLHTTPTARHRCRLLFRVNVTSVSGSSFDATNLTNVPNGILPPRDEKSPAFFA
jgi:hypothetical protein